jgi:hypothetical protein
VSRGVLGSHKKTAVDFQIAINVEHVSACQPAMLGIFYSSIAQNLVEINQLELASFP